MGCRQACKEIGFFYLENHGVPADLVEQVFQGSKAFFSLSQDDKMSVKVDKNNRGYTPMHEQVLDPANQTKGDTKVIIRLLPPLLLEVPLQLVLFCGGGSGGCGGCGGGDGNGCSGGDGRGGGGDGGDRVLLVRYFVLS